MRIGMNPNAQIMLPPLPAIVAAVITHLPNRKGYHEHRFEVIQRCLSSMLDNAYRQIPLYIWDNGSDTRFRSWLTKELKPDYLMLSPNIGKASARTAILRTFPNDTVVCMSDDDIYYEPGWLSSQLDLLYTYPNVGMVSGCPVRTQARWGVESTLKWAQDRAQLTMGRFIPDEWEYDFCRSIGRDIHQHMQDSANDRDYLVKYQGSEAYAMAHHMQFLGFAGRLGCLGLWTNQAMRAEQHFDVAVDRLGLLRLTTTKRYTWHMGNVLEKAYA